MAGLTEFQLAVNESLASAIDTAFSYPYEESYQTVSVGFNGGEYVYIQGTPAGDQSGKFLYPTFQSLIKPWNLTIRQKPGSNLHCHLPINCLTYTLIYNIERVMKPQK